MEIETIISIIGLLAGGGGIGGWFTYRYQKRKEKAEAEQSEASAAKEVQDVYQQLMADVKADREEQKAYIQELKDDRRHLRAERDELRKHQDDLDEKVRQLQREVARNGRMVEMMRPFLCYRAGCAIRVLAQVSAPEETEEPKKDIEPLDMKDL